MTLAKPADLADSPEQEMHGDVAPPAAWHQQTCCSTLPAAPWSPAAAAADDDDDDDVAQLVGLLQKKLLRLLVCL
jgi:hypothetical protein